MINRLLNGPNFLFNRRHIESSENSERPFNFAAKQQLMFAADLEEQLVELEQRYVSKPCASPVPQQRINTAVATADSDCEPCTYDDFGLVVGVELDVCWM